MILMTLYLYTPFLTWTMTQPGFPSGMESIAAWTDLKSPFPLISTLMVRLIPNFCVNKGESMTFCASKPRAQHEMQKKTNMIICGVNVEA